MHNSFGALMITHATAGAVMLLSGVVAMSTQKGRSNHRISGKTYAIATAIVGITGFIIAINKNNQFLEGTSLFVLYMMVSAYRSLYLKQLYKVVKAEPIDWLIISGALLASGYLLYLGLSSVLRGGSMGIVPVVFGLICLSFSIRDIRKFTKGPADKKHWLFNHISGMGGSYIAGITAFLAVNAGYFSSEFMLSVWLLPSLVGTPMIILTIRKYRSKKDAEKTLNVKLGVNAIADSEL